MINSQAEENLHSNICKICHQYDLFCSKNTCYECEFKNDLIDIMHTYFKACENTKLNCMKSIDTVEKFGL